MANLEVICGVDGLELANIMRNVARVRWENTLPKLAICEDLRGEDMSGVWAAFKYETVCRYHPELLANVHVMTTQPPRQVILFLGRPEPRVDIRGRNRAK